jgi:hypothetical protein
MIINDIAGADQVLLDHATSFSSLSAARSRIIAGFP